MNRATETTETTTERTFVEGDEVVVTGPVFDQGQTGVVTRPGRFVVVSFDDGTSASFHSSDVTHVDDVEEEFGR